MWARMKVSGVGLIWASGILLSGFFFSDLERMRHLLNFRQPDLCSELNVRYGASMSEESVRLEVYNYIEGQCQMKSLPVYN